nr:MAG TPA: Cro/C1-type HTH DNA-binding domain protein [Caudoviricetes sp.]
MSDIDKIISRLNSAIINSGYSYAELEKKSGISKSALQRYATGKTKKIPLEVIDNLAPILDVSPAFLMGWESDKHFNNLENNPDAIKNEYDQNIKYLMEHEGRHLVDLYKDLINNESLILLMDKAAKLKPADVANLIRIADAFEKEVFGEEDESE